MLKIKTFSSEKFEGTPSKTQLKHLLNRTLFGASFDDIKYFEGKNIDAILNELTTIGPPPTPPVNYYESRQKDSTGIKEGETWINALYGDGDVNFRRRQSLRYWWIQNMWFQQKTLEEKMILFWHNHFATQIEIYDVARSAYLYQNTLRKHAFGNLKEFVKAISIDPAMLEYLNGQKNGKESPDENYARELQELFTIGKGPESNYNEADVRAAARVLTGHRYDWRTITYNFNAFEHDTQDKAFSAYYGNKVIKGRTGQDGKLELDDLIEMIFQKEEVSKFIVRKLYRFFVYYEINGQVEKEFIEPIAKLFRESNYEIKPMIKAFLGSKHVLDSGFYASSISSPLENIVKTLRQFMPLLPPRSESIYYNYSMTGVLMRQAEGAQQYIGDPPTVAGWAAYYQAPLYNQLWINADTYQKRSIFVATFFYNEFKRDQYTLSPDLISFVEKMPNPGDPTKLVDDLVFYLLPIDIEQSTKQQAKKDILLSGQENDFYWTDLWQNFQANKMNKDTKEMVYTRIQYLIFYLHSLPEYQLQ